MNRPARRRSSKQQSLLAPAPEPVRHPSASATATATNNGSNSFAIMDGAHRKIELQSPEDLTYLINNVRRAAAEHIGDAFPPIEGDDAGGDELRMRIEQMVEEYISQTFTLAAPNLSINGFDLDRKTFPAVYLSSPKSNDAAAAAAAAAGPEEIIQYEPFDARKRARVEDLAREEEDLMREIAALKKTLPAAAARQYADGFWEGLRGDEDALAHAQASLATPPEGGSGGVLLEPGVPPPLERREDVEREYRGVVGTLGRLKREMPATVARMERARVAGEYVITER
ncbi:unnamed protein product [Discula destructiva]